MRAASVLFAVSMVCLATPTVDAQVGPATINWSAIADSTIGAAVAAREIPGGAIVVVSREQTLFTAGFGVSRIDSNRPVTDTTLFEVGSVGKLLTAIAVLQQVERGELALSENINTYLTGWQLNPPGDSTLTLNHLLTHSGGLNDRAIGYAVRSPDELAPLNAHLAANFPTFFDTPGRTISYSNCGYGLAGLAVESVTGTSFQEYVLSEILGPIGIRDSGYRPNSAADVAVGYRKSADDFVPFPALYRPVTPAGSLVANARDMATLLGALLNGGAPILSSASLDLMMGRRKSMHPDLMANAYGLEESRWGSIPGFGKGGSIPGFTAFMAVLPVQEIGLFAVVNGTSDEPIENFILASTRSLSEYRAPLLRTPVPADVSRYAGEYRSNRYDRTSVEKLLRFEVHQIYETADGGGLTLWHDGSMQVYQPVGEALFQHSEDPHRMLAFARDDSGEPTHAYFNDRFAGGYVPVVWERTGFWNSNQYVNEYFGIAVLGGLSYLLLPAVVLTGMLIRRGRARSADGRRIRKWMHLAGFLTSALLLCYAMFYFIPLLRNRSQLVFGIPESIAPWGVLPLFIIAGFGIFALLRYLSSRRDKIRLFELIYGIGFIASGALFAEFCIRWNLL